MRFSSLDLINKNNVGKLKLAWQFNSNDGKKGIQAKVHYPLPMYLQESVRYLKHKKGDFPVTDEHTKKIITFPCDQHLSLKEKRYVIKCVKDFYNKKN